MLPQWGEKIERLSFDLVLAHLRGPAADDNDAEAHRREPGWGSALLMPPFLYCWYKRPACRGLNGTNGLSQTDCGLVQIHPNKCFFFLPGKECYWCNSGVCLCAECVYAPVVSSVTLDPAEHLCPLSRTPLPPARLRPSASVSISLSLSLTRTLTHTHFTYTHTSDTLALPLSHSVTGHGAGDGCWHSGQ